MRTGSNSDVLFVVPVLNEERVIADVIEAILAENFSVVVIDDGSIDRTAAIALQSGANVLQHPFNLGQGAALQTGFDWALKHSFKYVVTFDGDGQHCVQDALKMLELARKNNLDLVLGSRFMGSAVGMKLQRRLLLKVAVYLSNLINGLKLTDAHNGLRVIGDMALSNIRLKNNRMAHASEFVGFIRRHQFKYAEFPANLCYTRYSMQKGQNVFSIFGIIKELFLRHLAE